MALKKKALVFLAILGACLVLSFLALASWLNSSRLEEAVSSALSENMGYKVTIGEIRPGFFNQLLVKKVRVTLPGEEKTFVQAEEIKIYYSWRVFLTNFQHFSRGVKRIVLVKPQIYLERNPQGEWNYDKLFSKETGKEEEFSQDYLAKLVVDKGEVFLRDARKELKDLHLTEVQGSLDLRNNPEVSFLAQGQEGKSWLMASGKVDLSAQKIDCQLQVKNFSVAPWSAYLPKSPYLTVTQGDVDAKLKVWGYYPNGLSYQGRALVSQGKVKSQAVPLPIEKINGEIEVDPEKVSLRRLAGFLGKTPVQLMGNVYLGQKTTLLDLDLQSPDIMLEEINRKWIPELQQVKRQGQLRGKISFLGPVDKIRAQGEFYLTRGQVYGQKVENFQLALTYEGNQVSIEKAETLWQGGKLKGQGIVQWEDKKVNYNLSILADNLPVGSLPIENKNLADLKGKLDGQLLISSFNNRLKVGGFVQLNRGSWRKIGFSQAKAHFLWDQGLLDLKYLIVDGPNIAGKVSGKIRADNQIDLQINVPVIQLNKLAAILSPDLDLKGKGSFVGQIQGSSQVPILEGDFAAYDGRLLQQDFEELTGKISWSGNKLSCVDVEMRDGITRHTLQGDIALMPQPILNLTLESKETRVEKLLRLANWQQNDLKGRVNSLLNIQGPLQNLTVQGNMEVTKGSWKEEELDRARIRFRWQDNLLHLEQVEAQQDDTFLTGQGWVKKNGEGELVLNVREVDLEKIPYLRYKLPTGSRTVNLLGKVRFNARKELYFSPLIIVHGKNSYRLTGKVNLGKLYPTMDLTMIIERGDLTILDALIPKDFPQHITGQLQGKVNFWGRIDNPNSRAMLNLRKASIGKYPIEQGKMDLVWKDGQLYILQFRLTKGKGFLAAQGSVDLQGQAQIDLAAQGLEGELLSELFGSPEKIEGIVNLTAQVRGKAQSPRIACSLDITKGKVRETAFDRLYGLTIWENGIADLQQLILKKEQYQLVAMGQIPTDPQSKKRINLKIKMEQGDLGLLTIFLDKQLDYAQGAAEAWLELGGTLKAPLIKGEIKIAQGKIKPEALLEPIEELEAHVVFRQDTLELDYLRGTLGSGSFQAYGKGENLFSPLSQLNFRLTAKNLKPKSKIFQGVVNGDLTLEGSKEAPLLKGQVTVAKGTANIPLSMGAGGGLKSGLHLDIGVNIRDNLRVKAMIADLFLKGGIHVGGTLGEPKLQGTLSSRKGTISYLEKKFRLTKGLIEFKEQNGIMPTLDLEGKTRYKRTAITLQVTGQPTNIKAHFTSDPALSEREILLLLTLGGEVSSGDESQTIEKVNLNEQLVRIAGESLPLAFLQGVEESLGRNLGLDELYISQNIWKGPQVTLGKYLWDDKVYLNYTMNTYVNQKDSVLGQEEKWYLEAQYKINKNFSLNYSRTSLGENQIMLTTSVSF